jgi:hypothetical protein
LGSGTAGFVERVNDDEMTLASAADDGAERVGEEVVEEFRRVFAIEFGNLRQGEQELAEVGQAGGELEGEAADDAPGVAVVGLVPFDELRGDDGVGAGVGELGGKGALAHARVAGDPEESGIALRLLPPFLHRLKQPLPSVEAFAQQLADAALGLDGFEMAVERFDFTGKAAAFVALHDAHDLGELGLIPFFPLGFGGGLMLGSETQATVLGSETQATLLGSETQATVTPLFPVVHVEPLDVANVDRRLHLLLALDKDRLDVAALHADGDGDFIATDAGVAGGML